MNIRRAKIIGLMTVGMWASGHAYATSITYTLNIPNDGDLTVAGTITTDGNMGALTKADIVSFNFSETSTSIPYTALFSPSDVDSSGFVMFGVGADATGLYIDPAVDGGGYLVIDITDGPGQYSHVNPIVLPGDGIGHTPACTMSCLEDSVEYNLTQIDASNLINPFDTSSPTYFATNGVAGPEPATYWPMLAGLMLISMAARRRRGTGIRHG